MNAMKTIAAAAVSVAAFAGTASAITVQAGDLIRETGVLQVGGQLVFDFTFQDSVNVTNFAMSASGTNGGNDIGNVTFGFEEPTSNSFAVTVNGTAASGTGFLPGGTFNAGDMLRVIVNDGIQKPVTIGLAFDALEIAPVPLPAAGGLLLVALAGGGAASAWKKRRKA